MFAQPLRLPTAALALLTFVVVFVVPSDAVGGQPFARYGDESRRRIGDVIDRAAQLTTEQDWSNYVSLGVAAERARWEDDALRDLRQRYEQVDNAYAEKPDRDREKARALELYQTARAVWEGEAEDQFLESRGRFRAKLSLGEAVERITEDEYRAAIANAEAETTGGSALDLSLWDRVMEQSLAPSVDRRGGDLAARLQAARSGPGSIAMSAAERAAFEQELVRLETQLRQDFLVEDSYQLKRARNRFVIAHTASSGDARLEAESGSAAVIGDRIIKSTFAELEKETEDMLARAVADMQDLIRRAGPNLSDVDPAEWDRRVEGVIDAGIRRWDLAEEDLYSKRLEWMREAKRSRAEAAQVWRSNHESLKREMTRWVAGVEEQIRAGRRAWADQHAAFADSRMRAETELAAYVEEKTRSRAELGAQLSELVRGGGNSLLEAKDARRYYQEILNDRRWTSACAITDSTDRALCQFYVSESNRLGESILAFQRVLLGTETTPGGESILREMLHGTGTDGGLLVDRRLYAGDLPDRIAELDEAEFESALQDLITDAPEDFVLYRRDISAEIDANRFFTQRTGELLNSPEWNLGSASTVTELTARVRGLDARFSEQREELLAIIARPRPGILDESQLFAIIRTDLDEWETRAEDRDARLRERVLRYFRMGAAVFGAGGTADGQSGLHQTGNENDPYLLTQAEYEWELLRRERNAFAARYERTAEVKRYADLAAEHGAGLELAEVTRERAAVAEARATLLQLAYELTKGDIALDPGVQSSVPAVQQAAVTAELARLLAARGVDPAAMDRARLRLEAEQGLLQQIQELGATDAASIAALRVSISAFLRTHVVGSDEADTTRLRERHRLAVLDRRLAVLAGELPVISPEVLAARLTAIKGTAGALRAETSALRAEYDFDGYNAIVADLPNAIRARTSAQLQGDLSLQRLLIAANATALGEARRAMDAAREAYRQAYLDLHILTSGNASELVEKELAEASQGLASVLHRMVRIEGTPGFVETVGDRLTKARVDYLREVSHGERAQYEAVRAGELLVYVDGLDAAKRREARLGALLAENDTSALSAEAVAALLLSREHELSLRSSDAGLASEPDILTAFDALRDLSAQLAQARAELAALDSALPQPPNATARRAELQGTMELAGAALASIVEQLPAAIRGERQSRTELLHVMLGSSNPDGSPVFNRAQFLADTTAYSQSLDDAAYDLSARAAARIEELLSAEGARSFADLVAQVLTNIADLGTPPGPQLQLTAFGTKPISEPGERAEWQMALRWLLANRAAIEYAGGAQSAADPRTSEQRWQALRELARDQAEDSRFHRSFQGEIPDSADHSWTVSFREERVRLRDLVNALLLLPATDQQVGYANLAAADRTVLESYGRPDPLRITASLQGFRSYLSADISAVSYRFRDLFLREAERDARAQAAGVAAQLDPKRSDLDRMIYRLGLLTTDRAGLEAELADAIEPAVRTDLQRRLDALRGEIAELELGIAALRPQVQSLQGILRSAENRVSEAIRPGSTSPLFALALSEYRSDSNRVSRHYRLLAGLDQSRRTAQSLSAQPVEADLPRDQVQAALGWVLTNAQGRVLRENGKAALTAEGAVLAENGVINIASVLSAPRTGPELARWTQRLQQWLAARSEPNTIPAEVRAAVELLEQSLREYQAALLFIDVTRQGNTGEDLIARATSQRAEAERALENLGKLMELETRLERAIEQNLSAGLPATASALAVIHSPESILLLRSIVNPAAGTPEPLPETPAAQLVERARELMTLSERLQEAAESDRLSLALVQFAETQTLLGPLNYRGAAEALRKFAAAHPELDATALIGRMERVADSSARSELQAIVQSAGAVGAVFSGVIAAVLLTGPSEGPALREAAIAAVQSFAQQFTAELAESADNSATALALLLGTGEADGSLDALIAEYARSRTQAEAVLLPLLETSGSVGALPPDTSAADFVAGVRTAIGTALAGPGFALMRGTALGVMEGESERYASAMTAAAAVSDPAERALLEADALLALRSAVTVGLTACVLATETPGDQDLADLREGLFRRGVAQAAQLVGATDEFPLDAVPVELRDVFLVREYQRAQARQALYHADRSDPARQSTATLNLTGINGDFARWLVVQELDTFAAAHPIAAFLAVAPRGTVRGIDSYIDAFLREHRTEGLSAGVLESLRARILSQELIRLETAAAAAGGLHNLNHAEYLRDFQTMIVTARVRQHATGAGFTVSGSTPEERAASYAATFAGLLASPDYGSPTFSEQFVGAAERESLFRFALSVLESSAVPETFLPQPLSAMLLTGQNPRAPPGSPDLLLPSALRAIAGYVNINYLNLARSAGPGVEAALLRIQLSEHVHEREDLSAALSDGELEEVIYRATDSRPLSGEVRAELVALLRTQNEHVSLGSPTTLSDAVSALRKRKVAATVFSNPEQERAAAIFLTRNQALVDQIEVAFFAELQRSPAALRLRAKEDRGPFLSALIQHARIVEGAPGPESDYYASTLQPSEQVALHELAVRLFADESAGGLSNSGRTLLFAESGMVASIFQFRSGQELVESGLFETVENAVFGHLTRTMPRAVLESARADRARVLGDFLNFIAHLDSGAPAASFTGTSGVAGLLPALEAVARELAPDLRHSLAVERPLIERFLTHYAETTGERERLIALISDPAQWNPAARKLSGYDEQQTRILVELELADLNASVRGAAADHGRLLAGTRTLLERQRALADELEKFARERGADDLNFTQSRFADSRTFTGTEESGQLQSYRAYVDGALMQARSDAGGLPSAAVDQIAEYLSAIQGSGTPAGWPPAPAGVSSFADHVGLGALPQSVLHLDPLAIVQNGSFAEVLKSDDLSASAGTRPFLGVVADPADDVTAQLRPRQVVAGIETLTASGTAQEKARRVYFANLANRYLSAVTNLAEALSGVARAVGLADARLQPLDATTAQEASLLDRFRAAYDPITGDASAARDMLATLQADRALHGADQARAKFSLLTAAAGEKRQAEDKFAHAGRRKFLSGQNAKEFVEQTFQRVATAQADAERRFNDLAAEADVLRGRYGEINTSYIAGLNRSSAAMRTAVAATRTAERLRSVADYAATPYMLPTTGGDSVPGTADAESEYLRARSLLLSAEERLEQSAYNVMVASNVADFTRVVNVLEGTDTAARAALVVSLSASETQQLSDLRDRKFKRGQVLSADDALALQTLSDRALYEEHRNVIETRAEYIKHALRMIRLTKAKEILAAEVERRESVVAAREQEYRSALSANFPLDATKDTPAARAAQLATYRRLAGIVESGGDLYREYRGWYYGTGPWLASMGAEVTGHWLSTGQITQPQVHWPTIAEIALGQFDASGIPAGEMAQIATYQAASSGGWVGYRDFVSAYQPYFLATGTLGQKQAELAITTVVMGTLSTAGSVLVAGGASLIALGGYYVTSGLALIATIVGAPVGTPMVYTGYGMIAGGVAMVGAGMTAIATATAAIAGATLQFLGAAWATIATNDNAIRTAFNDDHKARIMEVRNKERRYEEALAALAYFKKAPDQKTAKERLVQWGLRHDDSDSANPLYTLTNGDLQYLFDRPTGGSAEYINVNGTTADPDEDTRASALDITSLRRTGVSRDSAGNRYAADPATWRTTPPGPLTAGYYEAADGRYTAIQVLNHNGTTETRYARIIAASSAEDGVEDRFYDLTDIMSAATNHGNDLLAARRDAYFAAGASGADPGFTMREREATLGLVLTHASSRTDGGVEFSGYGGAFDEYAANANAIAAAETNQRVNLQRAEWDLRAAELRAKEEEWDRRFAAILNRGKKSWAGALNRLRSEWRQWEKDFDEKVAAGDQHYAERIKDHFTAKQKWEEDTRSALEERTVSDALTGVIGNLNAQITALNANANIDLARLNTLEQIQKQLDEIRKDRPGSTERLKELNASIAAFSTQLGMSELSHQDFSGITAVTSTYNATLKGHQRDMTRLAKAKAVEQFQDLLGKLKEQIRRQNQAIDQQTANAAAGAGYMRQGDRFIRVGTTLSTMGVLNAYQHFDGDSEITRLMAASGFSLKTGEDLTNYLTNDNISEAEASAYFDTQRYALQTIFDKIIGTGSASERQSANDERVLGTFGRWAGRAPDSRSAAFLAQHAKLTAAGASALPHAGDLAGFGELGAFGARPSGTAFGFYVQLQFMGAQIDRATAAASVPNIDPVSAGMGSILPVSGFANSYLNYQINTQVRGMDGSQATTQLNNQITRGTLKAGGMLAAGLGTGGLAYAGMGGIIAGNMLQDNGHLQLTDRGVVGIGSSSLALMGLGAGANVISGGFNFNDHGRATGDWSLSGVRGDAVGAGILGSAFGGAVGAELGGSFGATIFGQGLGAGMAAYGQGQTGNEAAWQAILGGNIESSLSAAGGIIQNSVSIHAGGPQSGGFLNNLMSALAKPFGDLWSIGSSVVGAAWDLATAVLMAPLAAIEFATDSALTKEVVTLLNHWDNWGGAGGTTTNLAAAMAEAARRREEEGVEADGVHPLTPQIEAGMRADYLATLREVFRQNGWDFSNYQDVIRNNADAAAAAQALSASMLSKSVFEHRFSEALKGYSGPRHDMSQVAIGKPFTFNVGNGAQTGMVLESYRDRIVVALPDGTRYTLAVENGIVGGHNAAGQSANTGPQTILGQQLIAEARQIQMHGDPTRGLSGMDISGSSYSDQADILRAQHNRDLSASVVAALSAIKPVQMTNTDHSMAYLTQFFGHFDGGLISQRIGDLYGVGRAAGMNWADSIVYTSNYASLNERYSGAGAIVGLLVEVATTPLTMGANLAAKAGLKLAAYGAKVATYGKFGHIVGGGLSLAGTALANLARGTMFEQRAMQMLGTEFGETIIQSQYRQGFAMRGFDFLSIQGSGAQAQLILNEAKHYGRLVPDKKFTAFGVNRHTTIDDMGLVQNANLGALDRNMLEARKALESAQAAGLIDRSTMQRAVRQLDDGSARIRLIGSQHGTRFSSSSLQKIQQATGMYVTELMYLR